MKLTILSTTVLLSIFSLSQAIEPADTKPVKIEQAEKQLTDGAQLLDVAMAACLSTGKSFSISSNLFDDFFFRIFFVGGRDRNGGFDPVVISRSPSA